MSRSLFRLVIAAMICVTACFAQPRPSYQYFRVGNSADASVSPRPGFALMGGGADLDEAFRWLCGLAGGGDLLVLRASGKDDYNPYIQKLCHLNSVATLVIADRTAAEDPFVAKVIHHASALFISGGDQAKYVDGWTDTPVQAELNAAIARGVPIGGTSAGLAVLGEYAYSAQGDKPDDPNLDSKTALADPFSPRVTVVKSFIHIPLLAGIITDTHFVRRDRMGRLLAFLARLNQRTEAVAGTSSQATRGIGVQERAAVLVDPDGTARVVGFGPAYFIQCPHAEGTVAKGRSLTWGPYLVRKVTPGNTFNLKEWAGDGAQYTLKVTAGVVQSTQAGGSVY
jgi:cyanophycinase